MFWYRAYDVHSFKTCQPQQAMHMLTSATRDVDCKDSRVSLRAREHGHPGVILFRMGPSLSLSFSARVFVATVMHQVNEKGQHGIGGADDA